MRPQLMPEIRERVRAWLEPGAKGERWLGLCCDGGQFNPLPRHRDLGADVANRERARLAASDLYVVTEQMTALALAAAPSLPAYRLRAPDLPSDYGLMVWESPIRVADGLAYTAASWGPTGQMLGPQWAGYGIFIVWYLSSEISKNSAGLTSDEVAWIVDGLPFIPEQSMCTPYNDDGEIETRFARSSNDPDDEPIDILYARTTDESAWPMKHKTLLTTWLMMQQAVATVASEYVDRPARRRLARVGITDPAPIRVVTLRHQTTHSTGTSDREYHHRWMVKGHWRNQWYPSQERHVPLWIHPHMKGPDGAPILGGEKVYAWTR